MIAFAITVGALVLIALIYILALCPGRQRKDKMAAFSHKCVSHRGLFNNKDIPENSIAAFKASIEKGFPIELDVQLTADGQLVVFHDEKLSRMCSVDKKVIECTFSELSKLSLLNTNEKIPKFTDVLNFINGKVPILIEIKYYADYIATTKALASVMDNYKGEYAVQSFHPRIVAWYRKNRPHVARGILSTKFKKKNSHTNFPWHIFCSTLLLNFYTRPDFVSFNYKHANIFPYRLARKLYRFENAGWTFKDPKALKRGKKVFNIYIFDSFIPESVKI